MFKSFMRYRGRYRKEKGFLVKWLDKEEKVIAFIIGHILLSGRYNIIKLTPMDVCLLYAIVCRIQTNWVTIFKEHILEVGMSEGHRLPYGVFISNVLEHYGVDFTNEKKQICGRKNLIGKATLTCIGMKKTSQGWVFCDENVVQDEKIPREDNVSDEEFETLNSEFEIRVNDSFKRASKRINIFNNSLAKLHEKMDILFKNYVEVSSSSEEFERRNIDDINEETTDEDSSESE
ncbi:hypothetical protein V8G54_034334 [Vigna mungo]|uniref:Uncharacterized protein n=1 Tax=Vigna mungo TaxID=3915 RepID=A0AAQ3RIE7_VIGMU